MNRRWIIITIVILLVFATGWGALQLLARLGSFPELTELKRAGEPISIADLAPKTTLPDKDNAATLLISIQQDADELVESLEEILQREYAVPKQPPGDAEWTKIAALLKQHPSVLEALDRLAECKGCQWPTNYRVDTAKLIENDLNRMQSLRNVLRIKRTQARLLSHQQNPDAAVQAILPGLKLARLPHQPCTFNWLLVITAITRDGVTTLAEVLNQHRLTPQTYQAIEKELGQHRPMDVLVTSLSVERAMAIDGCQAMRFGPFPLGGSHLKGFLTLYADQIKLGNAPAYQIKDRRPPAVTGLAGLMSPALTQARSASNKSEAQIRCLRILNAIQARNDPQAECQLWDLALPKESLVDPFSGKPLLIKNVGTNWLVYSVGTNLNDDQANAQDELDLVVGLKRD